MDNSDTEYQPIPTAKETINRTSRRCWIHVHCIYLSLVIALIGTPWIVWGAFKYDRTNRFITQAGLCRVNAITIDRIGNKFYSIWNVNIVRQSNNSNTMRNLTVLHSSLSIRDTGGYWLAQLALEDAEVLHSIGNVYPCYYRKYLLNPLDSNTHEDNPNDVVLWKKPSRAGAIVLISVGFLSVIIGILVPIIIIRLYFKT